MLNQFQKQCSDNNLEDQLNYVEVEALDGVNDIQSNNRILEQANKISVCAFSIVTIRIALNKAYNENSNSYDLEKTWYYLMFIAL